MSSTKAAICFDLTTSGREFTYIRKKIGPRIDPFGTPEVTGKRLAPNIVTRWDRLCRYGSSHVSRFPLKPYWCSFLRSFAWFAVTKAFHMSRYIISSSIQLSANLSRTSTSWVTHNRSAMKPCWHALIRLKTWSLIALSIYAPLHDFRNNRNLERDRSVVFRCYLLYFLKTRTMFASFQSSGRQPNLSDVLNNLVSEGAIKSVVSLKIFAGN